MCAIAGLIGLPVDEKTIRKMLTTMQKRGPDASSYHIFPEAALLHSRLAVIDPEGGAQPMQLSFGEKHYTIVYNGELYNTAQLRGQLERMGHHFRGHSDTEVLLHCYCQWGAECLQLLNGIFAFAVWEHESGRLFLARDRMGVKPLFYKCHEGGLLFASEIKTILMYPTVKAVLTEEGAAEILLLGPGRTPGCGVFKDVFELPGGYYAEFAHGRLICHQYWKLTDREHHENFAETTEHVRWLVTDAIKRQLVSDVPIGTFLSGGLDSSIISAIAAEHMKGEGKCLNTFSVDYLGNDALFKPDKFQPNSDGAYIRRMCQTIDSTHHWTVLRTEDLIECLEEATCARDLPGMADVDFSLLAFCKQIRKHVTVALSGECADEIFGGYPWYRDADIRDRDGFPWSQNIEMRLSLLSPSLSERIDGEAYVRSRYENTCSQSDILPGTDPTERRMKEMVNLNMQWFMQTLLDRKDRMSMYSGLEVRVPFCDYRIAEYLYAVPWEFKNYQGVEKGLLRHAVAGLLPDEVLWRKKSPYPKTLDPRYEALVRSRLNERLLDPNNPLLHLLDQNEVRRRMDAEERWPWYGQLMRRPQWMAYMLQIDAWLTRYNVELTF